MKKEGEKSEEEAWGSSHCHRPTPSHWEESAYLSCWSGGREGDKDTQWEGKEAGGGLEAETGSHKGGCSG
jgi:hypothetical protein